MVQIGRSYNARILAIDRELYNSKSGKMNEICIYCGRGLLAYNYCIFCKRVVAPSKACELYKALLRDIEDLSLTTEWREHWYYSAQHLKELEPAFYYEIMARARNYNKELQEAERVNRRFDRIIKEMFNRHGRIRTKEMDTHTFANAFTAIAKELATPGSFD